MLLKHSLYLQYTFLVSSATRETISLDSLAPIISTRIEPWFRGQRHPEAVRQQTKVFSSWLDES